MKYVVTIAVLVLLNMSVSNAQSDITVTLRNTFDGTPVSIGDLSLYDSQGGEIFEHQRSGTSGTSAVLQHSNSYKSKTDKDRLYDANNNLFKHHWWSSNVSRHKLLEDFDTPPSGATYYRDADFITANKATIFNNFEEFTDAGVVKFSDPWYVDANNEQNGTPLPFASPYIPTGSYWDSNPAILLEKQVQSGMPYYTAVFDSFLDKYDYVTPLSRSLEVDDWVFVYPYERTIGRVILTPESQSSYWSNSNGTWQRNSKFEVDVEFRTNEAKLYGFYKRHRSSVSETEPTSVNSQAKLAKEQGDGYVRFHQIYESGGKIYYTWSEDDGDTWEGEVLLSDYTHTCHNPTIDVSEYSDREELDFVIYAAYADASTHELVIIKRNQDARPTDWVEVDRLYIPMPSATHASLATTDFDRRHFTLVVWEDELSSIRYSLYDDDGVVNGDRITPTGTTPDIDLRNLVAAQPSLGMMVCVYPAVAKSKVFDTEFGAVWADYSTSLRDLGKLKYKGFRVGGNSANGYSIEEAQVRSASGLPIRFNTPPSMTSYSKPIIAYENILPNSQYPVPSGGTSWPRMIAGRAFYPITSFFFGFQMQPMQNYCRVICTKGDSRLFAVSNFTRVLQVVNLPSGNDDVRAPFVGIGNTWNPYHDARIGMNFDIDNNTYFVASLHSDLQSPVRIYAPMDGTYPQIARNEGQLNLNGLFTVTQPGFDPSPGGGAGSEVFGVSNMFHITSTTANIRKSRTLVENGTMREFVFTQNDTSRILYGVSEPQCLYGDSIRMDIEWETSADTIPYEWWHQLRDGMRTKPFTVPNGAAIEFANELYATYVADFGSSFQIRIEFRDATEDTLCYSEKINMRAFVSDSSEYVVDRINVSMLAGRNVYMCFNPIDTSTGCTYNIAIVTTPIFSEQEKTHKKGVAVPTLIQIDDNFPNPFTSETAIPFEIAVGSALRVHVYDVYGRFITTIFNGYVNKGRNLLHFAAKDLPSGTYICRFETDMYSAVTKLLLVR